MNTFSKQEDETFLTNQSDQMQVSFKLLSSNTISECRLEKLFEKIQHWKDKDIAESIWPWYFEIIDDRVVLIELIGIPQRSIMTF